MVTWAHRAILGLVVGLLAVPAALAQAEAPPLLVTYGAAAPTREGDQDHREIIFFSLPAGESEPLYLRLLDPDVGSNRDLIKGPADSSTRFALFGGAGAFSQAAPPADGLTAGQLLGEQTFSAEPERDEQWLTLLGFTASQGERIGERAYFRLVVQGLSGDDGNLYSLAVSLRDRRNLAPAGLRLFAYQPTVRVPDGESLTELRFRAPDEAAPLTFENFDAANGQVTLATRFRSLLLTTSGQDAWQSSERVLRPDEQGAQAAVLFAGGDELPNDATFRILDGAGRPIAIELPPLLWRPNARPVPQADLAPLADCASIAFDASGSSDADGDALTFAWDFGDGVTGDGASVVHRYGPGRHVATLQVVDSSGQIGVGAERQFELLVPAPPIAKAGPDLTVAEGETIRFDGAASVAGERPIVRYLWDFGDGSTALGVTAQHRFPRPGRYLVSLRAEDGSDLACNFGSDELAVTVNAAPVAVAGADQLVAVGDLVAFDGGRSYDRDGRIASHRWRFGDGAEALGGKIEHRYQQPGRYEVELAVEDAAGAGNSLSTDRLRVVVNAPPMPAAGADRRVAPGEVVTFDGSGSKDPDGRIVAHDWDLGDGRKAQGAKVSYAYPRPGRYPVTLTVRDDSGTRTSLASDALEVVVNAPPVAAAGPDQLVTASLVRFDGTGSRDPDGAIADYRWTFGDGRTGTGPRPEHVYERPGSYQVRLTVADDSGTPRNLASDTLQVVVNAAPIADAGPDMIVAPGQEVTFSGARSLDPDGDLAAYLWDFRDGSQAEGAIVRHRFAAPGVYQVRLQVADATGQPAAIATDHARIVVNAPPVADAGPDLLAAPGEEVRLESGGSFDPDGRIVAYRWDFSDDQLTLEGAQVVRTYAQPGIYRVQLTAIDNSGASNGNATDEVTVRINAAPQAAAGSDIFAGSTTLAFDGSASTDPDGDPLTYRWNFGDGSPSASGAKVSHSYVAGGTYPVVLEVDDGTGLRNGRAEAAITAVIDRPPVADAGGNRAVCAGDVVVFDGSRSQDPDGGLLRYDWDFGDGTKEQTVNPTKVYKTGKVYPVTLTVHDESGLPGGVHRDRIAVRVAESPLADAGPDQTVCAGSEVHFDGGRSSDFDGIVNRFLWNFGDGQEGGGERPVHVYGAPGSYRVALTIWGDEGGACDSSNTDQMTVVVRPAPVPQIDAPAAAAAGSPVRFDASRSTSPSAPITSIRWDFGDGTTAEGAQVEHVYARAGAYIASVSLATAGASACKSVVAKHAITVNAPPLAVAGADRAAAPGEELLFDAAASSDPDGAIASYRWDFGDGGTATGAQARHRFRGPGKYAVSLTVDDGAKLANSEASDTQEVLVNAPPEPQIAAPAAACIGEQVAFDGSRSTDPDGTIRQFRWQLGPGPEVEGVRATRAYDRTGRYDIRLVADDGLGLVNSAAEIGGQLHVNQPPAAAAGADQLACPDTLLTFDAGRSHDIDGKLIRWLWEFGDGSTAEGPKVAHSFAKAGDYRVRLSVTDDSGSQCATTTDTARVVIDSPPLAKADGDLAGFAGGAHDVLRFDASGSADPDGGPLSYFWELGDGLTATGETIRHGYLKPGAYRVRLTVQDGSGLPCGVATDELAVQVAPRAR